MRHILPAFWQREDIVAEYAQRIDFEQLQQLREQRWGQLERTHWQPLLEAYAALPSRSELERRGDYSVDCSTPTVRFGDESSLTEDESSALYACLKKLMPWRKGPFEICGQELDAEWRSDYKWSRLEPHLPELRNKLVLDIGCSNGYYMFRSLEHQPWSVLGIDPSEKFLFAFELFQKFGAFKELQYELLGVEELGIFPQIFDVVFCFGILYHHRDPLRILRTIHESMRPGATLVVESQTIPGDEPVSLCPPGRYAKARNIYFVPTASCIQSWLLKSGFRETEVVSHLALGLDEQRKTKWMEFESLSDFLDSKNSSRTIEGFPAPWRSIVVAKKP